MKKQHILIAIAVTAIWGLNFSIIKIGLKSVDPFILAGIRFALCALPAVFFLKRPQVPWRHTIGYGLVFGVGLWGMVNLGIKAGLSSGIASLVLQFSAFLTILLGAVVFRESLSRFQYLGIAVALTGLFSITFVTDGTVTLAGIALVLFGAVSWSIANVILKKAAPKDTLAFIVWSSLFSPIPLFLLDLAVNGTTGYTDLPDQIGWAAILSILFQAYPNTVLGYAVWNWLLREYPVSTVAPLSLLVPVFGVLGSMLIFNEPLPPLKLLAGALIVTGLVIGLYGKRLAQSPTTTRLPTMSRSR
ncbi:MULTISPECIES: EamA family transporter [Streptomyces]|uniref:EamA family transporter n=1 Tax=Streptomyces bangladeshensis TaxID=295352 RepID=A0ABN1ZJM9_9ACTN|nr:EamA family transporter [Streptomyces sp. FBKL.4005]OYP10392.1 EamA family transporter [Streptomyces sp. FBKL.4005]CUW33255.1 putative amino-acid metabolite efflux pump [Streptomyces reticuli]